MTELVTIGIERLWDDYAGREYCRGWFRGFIAGSLVMAAGAHWLLWILS